MRQETNASRKTLFRLGLTMIFGFSLIGMMACSEDDVKDIVADAVDIDVEAEAELRPGTLAVTKTAATASLTRASVYPNSDCGTTTIQALVAENEEQIEAEIEEDVDFEFDFDDVDIEDITLVSLSAEYTAISTSIPSGSTATLDCALEINDELFIDVALTAISNVDYTEGDLQYVTNNLTQDQIDLINSYLDHPGEAFDYCLSCSDDLEQYGIDYDPIIGILIEGQI